MIPNYNSQPTPVVVYQGKIGYYDSCGCFQPLTFDFTLHESVFTGSANHPITGDLHQLDSGCHGILDMAKASWIQQKEIEHLKEQLADLQKKVSAIHVPPPRRSTMLEEIKESLPTDV